MARQMITWVHPEKEGNSVDMKLTKGGVPIEYLSEEQRKAPLLAGIQLDSVILDGHSYDLEKLGVTDNIHSSKLSLPWEQLGVYKFLEHKSPVQYGVVGVYAINNKDREKFDSWKVGVIHPVGGIQNASQLISLEPRKLALSVRELAPGLRGSEYENVLLSFFEFYMRRKKFPSGTRLRNFEMGSFREERAMGSDDITRRFELTD